MSLCLNTFRAVNVWRPTITLVIVCNILACEALEPTRMRCGCGGGKLKLVYVARLNGLSFTWFSLTNSKCNKCNSTFKCVYVWFSRTSEDLMWPSPYTVDVCILEQAAGLIKRVVWLSHWPESYLYWNQAVFQRGPYRSLGQPLFSHRTKPVSHGRHRYFLVPHSQKYWVTWACGTCAEITYFSFASPGLAWIKGESLFF